MVIKSSAVNVSIKLPSLGLTPNLAAVKSNSMSDLCPCCSTLSYADCCEPYHLGMAKPATPEILMRSRYCAYALHLIDYLVQTTHPANRNLYQKDEIENWAKRSQWLKLEICNANQDKVEFKAYYLNGGTTYIHHENSTFKKEHGIWYYLKGSYFN